jgi:hypothetical protein
MSNVKETGGSKSSQAPYPDSLGDDWEPKDDLAASIADHQRFKEERRIAAARRRRRFRLTLVVLLIILSVAGLLFTHSYFLQPKEAERKGDQEFLVVVEPEANLIEYMIKKATVTLPTEGGFDLRRYEFDRNTFLRDKTALNQEALFREAVSKISDNLHDSWLIIFAGASVDGKPSLNRDLCRKRVIDVANMMRQIPSISTNRYWGIPAGEKRLFDSQGRQLDEIEEENVSIEELARERILIVIAIRPRNIPTSPNSNQPSPRLIEVLYENKLLPTDYDYPGRELAPV